MNKVTSILSFRRFAGFLIGFIVEGISNLLDSSFYGFSAVTLKMIDRAVISSLLLMEVILTRRRCVNVHRGRNKRKEFQ